MTRDIRAEMIAAAEELLVLSPDNDIATRAVCEAVGVTQPVLYRLFGDKNGLLDALADDGLRRYAEQKAALPESGDVIEDLRVGWDDHMDFALANPALYQLMFAPRPQSHSVARRQIFELLVATLVRVSAAGALKVSPVAAAQLILPANVGLALTLIAQPALFEHPALSHRMRDAVFSAVLTSPAAAPVSAGGVPEAAQRLRSQLAVSGTQALEPVEAALLDRWLERLGVPASSDG
ncbi:TetR/AcrR family transcriptional regulator [Actinoplanes sp. RD1]|uniref:TetR/AcrR family transcriptional regulator n=1 Tax=Actinoplanes sp. RD1 TaxID=3064538 RepID=UPI0027428E9C|nr:TetR/AcrR family transcriptional regulator [Actinoplanes sp. RD1]